MPSRFVQTIINQVKDVINKLVGVVNEKNIVIACSDLAKIGTTKDIKVSDNIDKKNIFYDEDCTYKIFNFQPNLRYIIFVEGIEEVSKQYANMISIMLNNSKKYYDEKHNKNNFIQNIALNNILPSDIYVKAQEFNLKVEVSRVTFLIRIKLNENETTSNDNAIAYETLNELFVRKSKDFIFNVNSREIALIKEFPENTNHENLITMTEKIFETLKTKITSKIYIGFSSQVDNIKQLEQSFKEANIALNIGEIFSDCEKIMNYNNLGIYRIIYQLPMTLCETFLKEVFKKMSIERLDSETFSTIHSFFENNLNISETSQQLFIHRNTLVYRLEKIKRLTGFDLRKFEDATIFKIAMMVKRYLKFSLSKN